MNLRRLGAVARKEWIHYLRDWRSLFLTIAIPMVLILLFGYALNMDLKNVPAVVWDQSCSPQSRALLKLFDGSEYFSIDAYYDNYQDIVSDLDSGRTMIALVIPSGFAKAIQGSEPVKIQAIADGTDANTARLAMGYAEGISLIYSQEIKAQKIRLMTGRTMSLPVELVPRVWYNPDLRSTNVIIPGILAMVMMIIAAMMTSVTVAKEWETGTMEQLISTPVRVPEIVLGKVIPYFVIGMLDVAIAIGLGRWLFHVPLRGSLLLVFAMAALFLVGALFFGLMISIVMKKQVLANQIAIMGGFLPTIILSGFVFPISSMPLAIQCITFIVPARYFIALLRGIYLKGTGLEVLWIDALLLGVYAGLMVFLAHKRLKLKLE
ncbi:MAG: ABC transporter permease [Thermodesulfobacteriota bacterium]|nr:ABC transporter permease [Thermodesulfobacteriota bacterium]